MTAPDLVPEVMRLVRSDSRRSRLLPIPATGGPASVAQHAITATVEHALRDLTSVQVRTCTLDPTGDHAGTVRLVTAVALGVDIGALAGQVRRVVTGTLATQFGWTAQVVDIVVDDLLLPEDGR